MTALSLLFLTAVLSPVKSIQHIPFGYQSNSAANAIQKESGSPIRDPSSFAGAIHYDPLHHALYMTGVTYATNFDGTDDFNLLHELDGWDMGMQRYTPKNGDCFYSVFKLPVDRNGFSFQPGNAIQGGVSLMHSRRFGSKSSAEACSAVDILPPQMNEDGLGGYIHEFENTENYNDFPPTMSPRPSSSSTYYPTYLPSVTAKPTPVRGVVPEEVGVVTVDPNDVSPNYSITVTSDYTNSNIARKVRLSRDAIPNGIISMKEIEIYDYQGNNIAIGKSATQSSDWSSEMTAMKAIDGNLDTFSHTEQGNTNEWWEVDLGSEVAIERIKIINRECATTNCLQRLSYVTLTLIDENGQTVASRLTGDTSAAFELEFLFSTDEPENDPIDTVATPTIDEPDYDPIETVATPTIDTKPTYSPTYLPSVTAKPTAEPPSAGLLEDELAYGDEIDEDEDMFGNEGIDLVTGSPEDINISRIAQKVKIQLTGSSPETLRLQEVRVRDSSYNNAAEKKTAAQSSDNNMDSLATNAIDGDIRTYSETAAELNAWWEVDLGSMTAIEGIEINQWCEGESNLDECFGRLSYATVSLIDENDEVVATRNVGDTTGKDSIDVDFALMPLDYDNSPNPIASTTADGAPTYSPTYLPSKQPSAGFLEDETNDIDPNGDFPIDPVTTWRAQKIRIELLGDPDGGPLTLVQVEVNEKAGTETTNVAAEAGAYQSSTVEGYPADNAVNLDYVDFSQTDAEDIDAWWEADWGAMVTIEEIVITNNKNNLAGLNFATVILLDAQGMGVAEINVGDVSDQEVIKLYPTDPLVMNDPIPPLRKLQGPMGGAFRPAISPMETRSVRLLVAGHVESITYKDGYIIDELIEGQYDEANVYGFTQLVDVRLPLGELEGQPGFMNDYEILNNPHANINALEYSLEEEALGGFVTSGIDARALMNDHLPPKLNTLYPVALVADSKSKSHYYVMILAADNAELNDEGKADSELRLDTTVGSGSNQQSWTDYDSFGIPGIVNPDDFFGKKGRPKFGSDYRIVLKKMEIDNVDPSCVTDSDRAERRTQSDVCKLFTSVEKHLSSSSYNRDTIVMSQTWVQEFEPDLGEDTRPAGLIFAPTNDPNSHDLLVMGGSTSGNGVAFGTTEDTASEEEKPERFDLDGFVTKIRADNGSFAGKDAFDAATLSFTNTHSMRISSLPNKHDVVASLCSDPLREWGTVEPQDHVYVVGSTEGLLPGLKSGLRDESFVMEYPEEPAVNTMEAFLMKVDLATMNTVWTTQISGINLVSKLKGNAYGFGCAVTHDGENVYLTGLVKDGAVVTDFSTDSLKRHDNAARGGTDVFVASYKANDGALNYLRQIGSTRDDTPSRGNGGITVDRLGNAIIVGNTRGSLMRKRDVAEYMFGQNDADAASDVFIMSLERDTGEYAPISDDSMAPVIPVDNMGGTEEIVGGSEETQTSATLEEPVIPVEEESSAASIFLFVILVLGLVGSAVGSVFFIYKTRKLEQRKTREMHTDDLNISPFGRGRRSTRGLTGKPGGSVLNQFEDMNIMVEVRNSASGGWHGVYDDDAIQQIDFLGGPRSASENNDITEQSLFMEDGLQALEEIENSVHNNYSIGDDDEDEEVTDEDLIQAYNEAMAIDIEPESEAVAALTQGLNMPNIGSDHHEII